jgi:hypothetical protein
MPGEPILGSIEIVSGLSIVCIRRNAKGVPGIIVAKIKLLRPMGVWS